VSQVVGLRSLLEWNPRVTREALQLLHNTAIGIVESWDGYLVEATNSGIIAAFREARQATMFSLTLQQLLLSVEW
jgi:RNase P/RNase MRP subunit POP5